MITKIGTDINAAIDLLMAEEIVAIPTETVYGLAANAMSEKAVLKIYAAKKRPQFNPLIIHVPDIASMQLYADTIPENCLLLARAFSPGPISFLLKKKACIPDLVTAGSDKVAIRIPSHPMTEAVLKKIDFPLAAPSANPFGYVSPVTAQHVLQGLNGKIPYILDGGNTSVGVESTIVSFTETGEVILERLGGISVELIEQALGQKINLQLQHAKPNTPGQLKSHYATTVPLYLGDINSLVKKYQGKRIAILSFENNYQHLPANFYFHLTDTGSLEEAAAKLFTTLRQLDEINIDLIIAEKVPDKEIGRAINDRLERAQFINKAI